MPIIFTLAVMMTVSTRTICAVPMDTPVTIMTADNGDGGTEWNSGHYLSMCREQAPKNWDSVTPCEKFIISDAGNNLLSIRTADDGNGGFTWQSGHYLSMCEDQPPKNWNTLLNCEKFTIDYADDFLAIDSASAGPYTGHYVSMCKYLAPKNNAGVTTCEKFVITPVSADSVQNKTHLMV